MTPVGKGRGKAAAVGMGAERRRWGMGAERQRWGRSAVRRRR
uniref:Uncharacterized protein n=1 Tax=Oryza glaberrima TaxID=4538 RepID=I1PSS9_ORYGL